MKLLSPILALWGNDGVGFFCPGCGNMHHVPVSSTGAGSKPRWKYNYRPSKPTFEPSINIRTGHHVPGQPQPPDCWLCKRHDERIAQGEPSHLACGTCHSFVTNGAIQFLGDCTHHLAGQTVPLPPIPARLAG